MQTMLKPLCNWGVAVLFGMALFGCAAVGTTGSTSTTDATSSSGAAGSASTTSTSGAGFHRPGDVAKLPQDARIGLAEFRNCGASYLDRLNPEYYEDDRKALFYLTCTELGYPSKFNDGLRQRLEQLLGRKLLRIKSDKPFTAKAVLKDAEKAGVDYVFAGDLLAMGETADETVVSAQLFVVRVADRKIALHGKVRKIGPKGKLNDLIDAVAEELFKAAFAD